MKDAFFAFARAVGWGTLAGAAPYLALLLFMIAQNPPETGEWLQGMAVLLLPLVGSGIFVLGSALVFGLPLTFFLGERPDESGGTYALAGIFLGAAVPIFVSAAMGGDLGPELLLLALPGAFAGLVTGTSWGRWREAQRAARNAG